MPPDTEWSCVSRLYSPPVSPFYVCMYSVYSVYSTCIPFLPSFLVTILFRREHERRGSGLTRVLSQDSSQTWESREFDRHRAHFQQIRIQESHEQSAYPWLAFSRSSQDSHPAGPGPTFSRSRIYIPLIKCLNSWTFSVGLTILGFDLSNQFSGLSEQLFSRDGIRTVIFYKLKLLNLYKYSDSANRTRVKSVTTSLSCRVSHPYHWIYSTVISSSS